ncbi:MAG: metallophosphoesterase [Candidatus Micrarchaeota archaeon]
MKIGIIADTHFGYSRFEEDAFVQAAYALKDAERKSDLIIIAGDLFDVKIPKLETLKKAADLFSTIKKPIYVIHGNHERRSSGMTNPVQLLTSLSNIHYINNKLEIVENIGNGKLALIGMGSVPEELAHNMLNNLYKKEIAKIPSDAFKILVIHQSIKELINCSEEELSLDYLKDLSFDLIINGHIHKNCSELKGKLLIPGSTVITRLKSDEQGERGYIIYDTEKKNYEFVAIPTRTFFYTEVTFDNASLAEVKEKIDIWISQMRATYKDAILKIKLQGTLREGLSGTDISFIYPDDGIYIQNNLNVLSLKEKIKQMKEENNEKFSVREKAMQELREKLKEKITLFDPTEFFEKLTENIDSCAHYLNL